MDFTSTVVNYFAITCLALVCYQVPNTGVVIVEMPDYPQVVDDFAMPVLREKYQGVTYVYLPPAIPI